jgi:hypothetical protein
VIYLIDKDTDVKYIDMEKIIFGENISYDISDSYGIMNEIICCNKTHTYKIYLIIDSSGGDSDPCSDIIKIIEMFKQNGGHIIALIPDRAYSAACAIAFACNEVHMYNMATISPTDRIICCNNIEYSTASYIKACEDMGSIITPSATDLAVHYDYIKGFDWSRKIMKKNLKKFFNFTQKNSAIKFNKVISHLCNGDIPHSTIFSRHDLTNMGLDIKKIDDTLDTNIIWFLYDLYTLYKWSY